MSWPKVLYVVIYALLIYFICRYGAIVMDDQNDNGSLGYTVLHNSSCQHAAPTFINLMNSAILRSATRNANMTIRTRNHPLPMTRSQLLQRHVCLHILMTMNTICQILIASGTLLASKWLNTFFTTSF